MSTVSPDEIGEVFDRVGAWPEESRRHLFEMLGGTLIEGKRPVRSLHGLFKADGPPPTDEDCRRILEEELSRKHLR